MKRVNSSSKSAWLGINYLRHAVVLEPETVFRLAPRCGSFETSVILLAWLYVSRITCAIHWLGLDLIGPFLPSLDCRLSQVTTCKLFSWEISLKHFEKKNKWNKSKIYKCNYVTAENGAAESERRTQKGEKRRTGKTIQRKTESGRGAHSGSAGDGKALWSKQVQWKKYFNHWRFRFEPVLFPFIVP